MKTVLITGAAGFIGSHLSEAVLLRGDRVIGVDNFNTYYDPAIKLLNLRHCQGQARFTLIREDIRNEEGVSNIFREHSPEIVVHLAAQAGVRLSLEDPKLYHDVNIMGTQNILDACREFRPSNVVLASSSSVYGKIKEVPFKETMDISSVISPYAATKRMNELMGHIYHELYGLNITMLRFFTVYGPRQRPDMAICKFTELIGSHKPIPMYGDGSTSRDYTYITDIVDGVLRSMDRPQGFEIFNLGGSRRISLKNLIERIAGEMGETPLIEQLDMQPGDVQETYADVSKAREVLGYEPSTPIETGIGKYVRWYLEIKRLKAHSA